METNGKKGDEQRNGAVKKEEKTSLKDLFEFYQNKKDSTKYAALKINDNNIKEYCILIYFTYKYNDPIKITNVITAEKPGDRTKINDFCSEIISENSEWFEKEFTKFFIEDRQTEIEDKINEVIHEINNSL